MKKLLLLFILSLQFSISSKAQCELMKVEIKDTTVKKVLKEYIALGYKHEKLTDEKGIVLVQFRRLVDDLGTGSLQSIIRIEVEITKDNFYVEFKRPYTNYTVVDGVIVLIEYEGQRGIIIPSEDCSKCIDKIVGNKVNQFPPIEEYLTTLPISNKRVKMRKDRKTDTHLSGSYSIQQNGKYMFHPSI